MKAYTLIILSFFILSSCSFNQTQPTLPETDEKQIIFFSDENNLRNESNYYDALLELRSKFPTEIANMKVVSSEDNRLYTKYKVEEYPSLLIVQQNKVLKKIEGNVAKDEIIIPLENVLSTASSKK
ncbi:Pal-related lipoprotein [Bacillus timonensis]|uniref:Pal-related lipoprotein n=1 Tax=Bacillus timonensis TaxID=1033734 RepID=UPI000288401A|nr:Pal-related lipoprotein [Bacillus timonensis]